LVIGGAATVMTECLGYREEFAITKSYNHKWHEGT